MRPDFSKISYTSTSKSNSSSFKAEAGSEWMTSEQIPVKPVFSAEDLKNKEHLRYAAGLPPFLRGPYSSMYVMKPWTVRQYAGFSTAEESNAFYRRNLAAGQKGFELIMQK